MSKASIVREKLYSLSNKEKVTAFQRFFKTGKGEYGEGDLFLGIAVPQIRKLSKEYKDLPLKELSSLLKSKFHEERALATFILVLKYLDAVKKDEVIIQKEIFNFYIKNVSAFNNWDLVDLSAPYITGHYFYHYDSKVLTKCTKSKNLWLRRIAILSCFYHIRQNDFKIPLKIIQERLLDKEDLIHKASGWMLREIGKRDEGKLCLFLDKNSHIMPRTALRYSIEKLSEKNKKYYMKQKELYENN